MGAFSKICSTYFAKGLKKLTYVVVVVSVTQQRYEVDVFRESVIRGNDALFKCAIPSFVADLAEVQSWIDSEGLEIDFGLFGNSLSTSYRWFK